jgi:glycosyltransferase involved in cell wall biosynthesis
VSVPRVAFFTDSFHEVNGVALTSREFVRFAAQKGYPFFSVHAGPKTRAWEEGALHTLEIAHSPFVVHLERDLRFDLLFYRHRPRIYKELRAFRPDVVHVTGPSHSGMLGAMLARELKVPLVASWHTNLHEFAARRIDPMLSWLGPRWRRAAANFTENETLKWTLRFYRFAELLFAPNPELVEMLASATGRPTYLMKRGIDVDLFAPERRTRTDDEFVIGFVGRLSPEKHVRSLADVERRLREHGISNYRFLVVGDGSERPWLMQNLKQAMFPGVLSGASLAEAYANMDAFVFPSQTDTFGNVVLEAMASGVPVIVSGCGGPKFLVQPGKNGYVAGDFDDFVDALMDLRTHPNLHAHMSQGARATAMRHSWSAVFEQVYARYEEVLAKGDPGRIAPSRNIPLALVP